MLSFYQLSRHSKESVFFLGEFVHHATFVCMRIQEVVETPKAVLITCTILEFNCLCGMLIYKVQNSEMRILLNVLFPFTSATVLL